MDHLNKVTGLVSLAVGTAVLALTLVAVVSTDAYSTGARTDANSIEVLTTMLGASSNPSATEER
jgi:hypothetical protein